MENMEEVKEVKIEGSISPIPIEKTKIILDQMQKSVCKMQVNGKKGTGFFAKIPFKKNLINVLITNNHVINEEKFKNGEIINLSLNNGKENIYITMSENRKKYTNEILDITIIELKEADEIKNFFLTLDKRLLDFINSNNISNKQNFNNLYEKESIYILNYIKEIQVSYGFLIDITQSSRINHNCSTEEGSSGSPIFLLESGNVIGVHYGHCSYNKNINFGSLLAKSLIEFQDISNNNVMIIRQKEKNNINSSIIMNNIKFNNINYDTGNINKKDNLNYIINNISCVSNEKENIINQNNKNNKIIMNNSNEIENSIQFNNINNINLNKSIKDLNQISSIIYDNPNYKETQIEIYTSTINNSQGKFHKLYLKNLIKLAYLKKELNSDKNYFQNQLIKAYIINKNIINKLIILYKFDEILSILDKNKLLKGISYQNFEDNDLKIKEFINEICYNYNNKISQDGFEENIELTENEKSLQIKHTNEIIDCDYLDDFEIIDEKFANLLLKQFINIRIYPVQFGSIKNKNIFIIINHEQKYFYEVMSLNLDNALIFEFLINIVRDKMFNMNKALNNYIFAYLCKNAIKSLIYKGNPIKLEKINIKFNLYSHKSINKATRNKNYIYKSNIYNDSTLTSIYNTHRNNDLNKTIAIKFKIIGTLNIEISIEINKKMNELIFMFFEKIKRQELFNDKSIKFFHQNEQIPHDSEELIKERFYNSEVPKIILIRDMKNKLRK